MRKSDFYLCETKGADQIRVDCIAEAGQRLCFRYTDIAMPKTYLYPKFQA